MRKVDDGKKEKRKEKKRKEKSIQRKAIPPFARVAVMTSMWRQNNKT